MASKDQTFYINKFWSFVKINKRTPSSCWTWKRGKNQKGYGHFSANGKRYMAHRWIWSYFNGPIPKGKLILHTCDNPSCVRLEHLVLGDHKQNMEDRNSKGRQAKGLRSGVNTKPHTRCFGNRCGKAKLDWNTVDKIRSLKEIKSTRQIAKQFGISPSQACKILNNIQWTDEGRRYSKWQ